MPVFDKKHLPYIFLAAVLVFSFGQRISLFRMLDDSMQATDSYADYGHLLKGIISGCEDGSCRPDHVLYYGHFGYIIAGAGVNLVFGDPVLSLRIISLVCEMGVMIMIFLLGKRVWGSATGLTASFLYGLTWGSLIYGSLALTRSFFSLLCLITVYLIVSGRRRHALITAAACSTVRLDGLVFLPLLASLMLWEKKGVKASITFILVTVILMFPSIILFFNWHYGWPIHEALNTGRLSRNAALLFDEVLNSVFLILFIAGLFFSRKKREILPIVFFSVLAMSFTTAFLLFPQFSTGSRHYLHLAPIVLMFSAHAMSQIHARLSGKNFGLPATIILLFIFSSLLIPRMLEDYEKQKRFHIHNRMGMKVVVDQFNRVPEGASIGLCRGHSRAAKYVARYFFKPDKWFLIDCESTLPDPPEYVLIGYTHRMQSRHSVGELEERFSDFLEDYFIENEFLVKDGGRTAYHTRLYKKSS